MLEQLESRAVALEAEAAKPARPLAERRAELKKRRQAWICAHLTERLKKYDESFGLMHGKIDLNLLALAAVFGGSAKWEQKPWVLFDKLRKNTEASARRLWQWIANRLCEELRTYGLDSAAKTCEHHAVPVAALLGLSWPALEMEAKNAIPEPKSWSAEAVSRKDAKPSTRAQAEGAQSTTKEPANKKTSKPAVKASAKPKAKKAGKKKK